MYCKYCGKEVSDNAVICVGCGRLTDAGEKWQAQHAQQEQQIAQNTVSNQTSTSSNKSGLGTTAKVFMILGCIFTPLSLMSNFLTLYIDGMLLINVIFIILLCLSSLAWTIPMTVNVCRKLKNNQPISTALKVCTLIFVNTIAGILLLCMRNENVPSGAQSFNYNNINNNQPNNIYTDNINDENNNDKNNM